MRKRANGKGSVYKLAGRRTHPWVARKTVGRTEKGYPVYKFIGYFRTYDEANRALTEYNKSPYSLDGESLKDMYERFIVKYEEEHKLQTVRMFKASWEHLAPIHDEPISKLTRKKLQIFFDELDATKPVKVKVKSTLKSILDYSIRYDVIQPEKIVILDYVDLSSQKAVKKLERKIFTKEEIERLYQINDEISRALLFLIYTGLRAGEFVSLSDSDIDEDMVIHINDSKTSSGIRDVPLSDKAQKLAPVPHFRNYDTFKYHFMTWQEKHGFEHTLHDTRHTCVTMLAEAKVDRRTIKAIVGHKSTDVTDGIYTHISIEAKREALNLL